MGLFVAMALTVAVFAGSYLTGIWKIDLYRPGVIAVGTVVPGHYGEPSRPLVLSPAVAPIQAAFDASPGRWTRPSASSGTKLP